MSIKICRYGTILDETASPQVNVGNPVRTVNAMLSRNAVAYTLGGRHSPRSMRQRNVAIGGFGAVAARAARRSIAFGQD